MLASPCTAHYLLEIESPGSLLFLTSALRSEEYFWWLDSAAPAHPLSRYSFVGCDPYWVLRARGGQLYLQGRREVGRNPAALLDRDEISTAAVFETSFEMDALAAVRSLLPYVPAETESAIPFLGGAVGSFGYELGREWEESLGRKTCQQPAGAGKTADLTLLFVDRVFVYDHHEERCFVAALGFAEGMDAALGKARSVAHETAARYKRLLEARGPSCSGERASTQLTHLIGAELYAEQVQQILQAIAEGEVYQACLTHRIEFETEQDPWSIYLKLRELNPAPFASYLSLPEGTVLSSSPERFLCVQAQGEVESRPIKGTRPRGKTAQEDRGLREELETSGKDCAENLMIADLVRNDLGRVCELGSVHVSNLQAVEDHATVFQMVTTVGGKLREECDALDALRACFPPGSMTGAPKIAAMRTLEALEPVERGIYSGGLGYLDCRGGMDLAVVIRTLLLQEGIADLRVGGGVVADSVPADEYQESLHKAKAWFEVLGVPFPSGD